MKRQKILNFLNISQRKGNISNTVNICKLYFQVRSDAIKYINQEFENLKLKRMTDQKQIHCFFLFCTTFRHKIILWDII
jgi:hypothetical protein